MVRPCVGLGVCRDGTAVARPGGNLTLALLVALAAAFAVTAVAVLASRGLVGVVSVPLAGPRARRRMEARAAEVGWTAAAAQRWSLTPAKLGGPSAPGFGELDFDALGLPHGPRHASVRHTSCGTLRLLPVAPCATLDGCAALLGAEVSAGGGLLVVGTDTVPEDAVAVLVLGPLVQVRLPHVPWAWVRDLMDAPPVAVPAPPVAAPAMRASKRPRVPAAALPQRDRRMPSWRSSKPTTRRRDGAPLRREA